MCLIALPRFRRKKLSKLVGAPIEFLAVRRRLFLTGYIRPRLGVFSIQLKPNSEVRFGVRLDGFSRAFGFAHAAIDALVRVNDEHVFALVEAVDRADLDAIQIFALYAVFHDHVGHTYILVSYLPGRDFGRSSMDFKTVCQPFLLSMLSAAMAQLLAFVGLFLK
jgi:hypothetical protein